MAKNKNSNKQMEVKQNSNVKLNNVKPAKKKEKKPEKVKRNRAKETISELKKVSWPSFGKTMKQTGMVISVVLIFMLLVLGIDSLVSFLIQLIV